MTSNSLLLNHLKKESKMKHMELPWKTSVSADYERIEVRDKDGRQIVIVRSHWPAGPKTEDGNAEFIVKACNSHYELLEACKKAKEYLEPDLVEPGRTVFWNLAQAIAKAEGENNA